VTARPAFEMEGGMEEIRYTETQNAAIEHRGGALLISASAGSGKTKVLVERLMRKITGPDAPDIDRFLIITYTKAAAAELRAKILEALSGRLRQNPHSRHIRRQISLCYKAQISTIHSFCSVILRENAHLLDIRPDFRVADAAEGQILQLYVLENVLEKRYDQMSENFRLLVDTMSAGRDDSGLCEIILNTYSALQSHPYPKRWLSQRINEPPVSGDAGDTIWGRLLLDKAKGKTKYWIKKLEESSSMLNFDPKVKTAYGPSIAATLESLRSYHQAISEGWDAAHRFGYIDFPRLNALRGYTGDETVLRIKAVRAQCKKAMEKLCDGFVSESAELIADLNEIRPAVDELFHIVSDFDDSFLAEKKRRGLMDFNDLEHFALTLLVDPDSREPTPLAAEIARRYDEILVDEYQDVNKVQDMIFSAVSRQRRNITMVGDVKQSIYRFRLADPSIFLQKYDSFEDNPQDDRPRRILLTKNFRSRADILDKVNYLFGGILSKELGEMDYTPQEYLTPGAEFYSAVEEPFELRVLEYGEAVEDTDKIEIEAMYIADRIKKLVGGGMMISENKAARELTYGDIAILLRSVKDKEDIFVNALQRAGIPAATQKAVSIFEAPEMNLLLSLLRVIDNPMQDVPLIAVLRSAIGGFTADELAEIRACDKSADFYTALQKRGACDEKCAAFIRQLEDFRIRAADYETDRLLRYIYDETELPGIAAAENPGADSRLLMLLDYARQFEEKGYKGLFGFISHLNELAEHDDLPLRLSGTVTGREVVIASIHSAKGLEYPVVFLADLAKKFNKEDSRKPLLIHKELGVGPKKLDLARRIEYPTLARLGVAAKIADETLSEEMRVLYVAMTRAKEKLIAVISLKDAEAKLDKLKSGAQYPLAPQTLETCESMGDWLLLAALTNPEIKISIDKPEMAAAPAEETPEAAMTDPSPAYIKKIRESLQYTYPHIKASLLPSKLTATELKGSFYAEEAAESADRDIIDLNKSLSSGVVFRRPKFAMAEKGLTASEKGTALHLVMQHIDFTRCFTIDDIKAEIERLYRTRMLTAEQKDAVSPEPIYRFFHSALGKRVLSAPKLYREFKFSLLVKAEDILPESGEEKILLQGVVDLCIEQENELTVIDFKTDYVNELTQKSKAKLYRGQLEAYGYAMERISKKPVSERLIYFFATGDYVKI
jgi:ATP-dependent helicase/nuclease subunit A